MRKAYRCQFLVADRNSISPDRIPPKNRCLGRMRRPEFLHHLVLGETVHALLEIAVAPRTSTGQHCSHEEDHPDPEQMPSNASHDLGWSLISRARFIEQ